MNNQEESLDLLDLDDNEATDTLPEATPFSSPRPKRPWLLMGLGVAIIVLATWIIIARVGDDSGTTVRVDLDAPVTAEVPPMPVADLNVPQKPVEAVPAPVEKPVAEPKVAEQPVQKPAEVKPVEKVDAPIRVIEDRKVNLQVVLVLSGCKTTTEKNNTVHDPNDQKDNNCDKWQYLCSIWFIQHT